jgi:hypothetical protein
VVLRADVILRTIPNNPNFTTTMKEYQVSCITKSPPNGAHHQHVTHIGGIGATAWRLTKESAIRRIESKEEAFFTVDAQTGRGIYVGVVRETGIEPFLRTHADGKWNDNLLAQPQCSANHAVID